MCKSVLSVSSRTQNIRINNNTLLLSCICQESFSETTASIISLKLGWRGNILTLWVCPVCTVYHFNPPSALRHSVSQRSLGWRVPTVSHTDAPTIFTCHTDGYTNHLYTSYWWIHQPSLHVILMGTPTIFTRHTDGYTNHLPVLLSGPFGLLLARSTMIGKSRKYRFLC